jgi:hypothetical protein
VRNFHWTNIRTFNGSQDEAFEELVCQLARKEFESIYVDFIRKGKPDAGVECFCILPNDEEIGVQAKYFLSSPQEGQWKQVDKSVQTALDKHPKLSKYIIAFPIDPADARVEDRESMLQKWNARVAKWTSWAEQKGMKVDFDAWWGSKLIGFLQKPENSGMLRFWFNELEFSDEWFKTQIERSVADLGKRYTPDLNFQLDISKTFDGLYRDERFKKQIDAAYDQFLTNFKYDIAFLNREETISERQLIEETLSEIHSVYLGINFCEMKEIKYNSILLLLSKIEEYLDRCEKIFNSLYLKDNHQENDSNNLNKYREILGKIKRLEQHLYKFTQFLNSETVKLSNLPVMILEGEAGSGKSHLLADIATQRMSEGKPSILLLGQHFVNDENPWRQILSNLLRIECNNEREFLGALDAKAQSIGARIIIIIDAINEGRGKYFWNEHIRSFIKSFEKYKWLGLVMSIRSSYVDLIAPEDQVPNNLAVRLTHYGFTDVEYDASKLFFDYYEIEQPSIPLLHPEFKNPLFLKIFCEGLYKAGYKRIPAGYDGITKIMNFYLKAINKQLSSPKKFDYLESLNLVNKIISKIIQVKVENNLRYIPLEEAYLLVQEEIGRFNIKNGFLEALIAEGVLTRNIFWDSKDEYQEGIYLTYERFDDQLTASYLIDKYVDKENPSEAFETQGKLFELTLDENKCYINKGIIEALSIQLPEKIGRELYEVAPKIKGFIPVIESFIESLIWRDPETITEKLKDYINEYVFKYESTHNQFINMMLQVTSNPNHYFNADFLHNYLLKFSLADRDAWWTIYLHSQFHEHTPVKRLIDWAWSNKDRSYISDDAIRLISKTMSWFLTSSNRYLRDSTTKGLICLLKDRIPVLIKILDDFKEVNDPYVYERLYAIAYGCALKTKDVLGLQNLSNYIYNTIFLQEEVYPHILLRDYARGVIEYSLFKGIELCCDVDKIRPPYKSKWSYTVPTDEEIKKYRFDYKEDGFKDYYWSQNEIISSMQPEHSKIEMYGDFGRYVFQSAFRYWKDLDIQDLSNIATKRVFELGYDVEKHGEFDRNVRVYSRSARKPERIGKKYQWIAFYELLAKVSDHYTLYDKYSFKEQPMSFGGPWFPYVRDIDPSLFIQNIKREKKSNQWWFHTEYQDWSYSHEKWLLVEGNLPNPSEIIEIRDPEGTEWLLLEAYPEWTEPKVIGQDQWSYPHKRIWYQLRSYLVKEEEFDHLVEWASSQNFMGRWMPESYSRYEIFLREYYWSPAYQSMQNINGESTWRQVRERDSNKVVAEVAVTTESFLWEEEYDCSKEDSISFIMPSKMLFNGMNMEFGEREGEFFVNGELVCQDPSVNNGGPSCLFIRKKNFLDFLQRNKLKVFWTVLGEKQIIGGHTHPKDGMKWLEISGVYKFVGNKVRGDIRAYK